MEYKDIQILIGVKDKKIFCQIVERHSPHIILEKYADLSDSPSDKEIHDAIYKIVPSEKEFPTFYDSHHQSIVSLREGAHLTEGSDDLTTCDRIFDNRQGILWGVFCSFFIDVKMEFLKVT